ncbi:MAG: 50S ribosomal protein L35 [Nitrospirota bacterium]
MANYRPKTKGYKLKSHRGAAKRFKLTAGGKIKRDMAFGSHLLTTKSAKRMRKLSHASYASDVNKDMLKKLLPGL